MQGVLDFEIFSAPQKKILLISYGLSISFLVQLVSLLCVSTFVLLVLLGPFMLSLSINILVLVC